ncbi:hypothetical protein ACLOJK_037800 [Asimina triloba]
MDGWFNEDHTRPSSSAGSFSKNLFHEYCQLFYPIHNGGVPGLAFKDNLPYLELQHSALLHLASNETQRQFYQTAIFNGCKNGEIEIGMSAPTDNLSNLNMQMEIRKLFPEDFIPQFQSRESHMRDQSRPSSSSSSLRSLSIGSPEYSVLGQMNMASTSNYTTDHAFPEKPINPAIKMPTNIPLPSHLQTMKAYDDAAMARAMLAVISSPTSSSSSYHSQQTQDSQQQQQQVHQRGAFKRYSLSLLPKMEMKPKSRSQHTMMKAIAYLRRIRAQTAAAAQPEPRPSTNQLHHMMSERKRREKLNESFQALRSLLPPGSKATKTSLFFSFPFFSFQSIPSKDKASVLAKTREHLSSLKAQVSELQEKNRLLETRLATARSSTCCAAGDQEPDLGNERAVVRVTEAAAASSSRAREIEVRVMVKEEECDLADLVVRLLECLNRVPGINALASIEADTHFQQQANSFHRVILRLNIQAGEWDEQALREALTRAAADVARRRTADA